MLALNSFCMFSSNLLLRSIISGLLSKACPEENEAFFFFFFLTSDSCVCYY